jgi:DNA-binding Xre family transcriptional regulator
VIDRKLNKLAKLTYNQALALQRGAYDRINLNTIARACEALEVQSGEIFEVKNIEAN